MITEKTTRSALKRARSKYQPVGQWITKHKRLAIYLRDAFKCSYCGCDLRDAQPNEINLDHVIPRCKGGTNEASNLVTSCRACNCNSGISQSPYDVASAKTRAAIRRQLKKDLGRYIVMAKALISGKTGDATS